MGPRVLAIRESRYKLVLHFDPASENLYDLEADPGEQSPLAPPRRKNPCAGVCSKLPANTCSGRASSATGGSRAKARLRDTSARMGPIQQTRPHLWLSDPRLAILSFRMITLFTPSFADEGDTNAQNLSVKEIVARLDPDRIAVTMFHEGDSVDPRIASRRNTTLLRWRDRGNTWRTALQLTAKNSGCVFLSARRSARRRVSRTCAAVFDLTTAVVTYIVSGGLYNGDISEARVRNIREADVVVANNGYLGQLLAEKYGRQGDTIL